MSWKRTLIQAMDRPGGRWLLGRIATHTARETAADLSIFYDGVWAHREGGYCFVDGPRFEYYPVDFPAWVGETSRNVESARDWWFQFQQPPSGGVIVDIGAGRGEDAIAFSHAVGATGRVIAVEAHPQTYDALQHFCRLNQLRNVTTVHCAVVDQPGSVAISTGGEWEANAIVQPMGDGVAIVPADRLENLCRVHKIETIDLLKMNIEGAERLALVGMEEMMNRISVICVACHDFRADRGDGEEFRTRAFVEDFLKRHHFQIRSRPDHAKDYVRDHVFGIRS